MSDNLTPAQRRAVAQAKARLGGKKVVATLGKDEAAQVLLYHIAATISPREMVNRKQPVTSQSKVWGVRRNTVTVTRGPTTTTVETESSWVLRDVAFSRALRAFLELQVPDGESG